MNKHHRPCFGGTLGLFDLGCLPVVAERMCAEEAVPRGAKGNVTVSAS